MKIKIIFIVLSLAGLLGACDKPDVGFFSYGGIRMQEDTLDVIRGIYQYSNIPMTDGSSRPLHFRLVGAHKYDTGEEVPGFTDGLYDLLMWKEAFNATLDTTMEQVNRKTYVDQVAPVMITENSGIVYFNSTTSKFPVGKYGIDVEVSNTKGSEVIKNYCILNLKSVPYTLGAYFRDRVRGAVKDETFKDIEYISSYSEDDLELIRKNKHPRRKIVRVGESDILELEMIIRDSKGTCISPKAFKAVWSKTFYRNTYEVNSLAIGGSSERYTYTDTSAIYRFPSVPYPSYSVEYSGTTSVAYVPMTFYSLDPAYFELTQETKDKAASLNVGVDEYSFDCANLVTFNELAKWRLEITVPYIISKGKQ